MPKEQSAAQKLRRRVQYQITLILLGIYLLCLGGCQEQILHDLDEARANRIKVILAEASIEAKKVREGAAWSIAVTSSDATAALAALDQTRVLKPRIVLPNRRSRSMIQTREERANILERNLAWNLEQTLERLPRVLEARVHLHFGVDDGFQLIPMPNNNSASVVLLTASAAAIDTSRVKKLVAGASGVPEQSVTVILVPTEQTPAVHTEKTVNLWADLIKKGMISRGFMLISVGLVVLLMLLKIRMAERTFRNRARIREKKTNEEAKSPLSSGLIMSKDGPSYNHWENETCSLAQGQGHEQNGYLHMRRKRGTC